MSELDLIALGVWWIPSPLPGGGGRVNAWAIEDVGGGITLVDCGYGAAESRSALVYGLAEAGATLDDVQRIILSHAHPEHCGGAPFIVEQSRRTVAVFASRAEAGALRGTLGRVHVLGDGDRFQFRHFGATVLELPGHTAGLVGLFADDDGILFSSDHLLHGVLPSATVERDAEGAGLDPVACYRDSLQRTAALDVRVVLPGRGAPFAGHRRVVREALASLGGADRRGAARGVEAPARAAAHHAA